MKLIHKYPIVFSILLILNTLILGRIFDNVFDINQDLKRIIYYIIILICLFLFIYSKHIPSKLLIDFNYINLLYYLPAILYVYVFSGGFNDFHKINFNEYSIHRIIIYTSKIYFSAFFEEILFRGIILGVIMFKFKNSNNSIFKSVFITSLLFGFTHIVNIWSSEMSTIGVYNQIYATFSLGFLYASIYLKTKNIYILIFIHFITNFFSQIGELENVEIVKNIITTHKTNLELILSEIIRLIIFGIPLFIGLFILKSISKKDVSMLLK